MFVISLCCAVSPSVWLLAFAVSLLLWLPSSWLSYRLHICVMSSSWYLSCPVVAELVSDATTAAARLAGTAPPVSLFEVPPHHSERGRLWRQAAMRHHEKVSGAWAEVIAAATAQHQHAKEAAAKEAAAKDAALAAAGIVMDTVPAHVRPGSGVRSRRSSSTVSAGGVPPTLPPIDIHAVTASVAAAAGGVAVGGSAGGGGGIAGTAGSGSGSGSGGSGGGAVAGAGAAGGHGGASASASLPSGEEKSVEELKEE